MQFASSRYPTPTQCNVNIVSSTNLFRNSTLWFWQWNIIFRAYFLIFNVLKFNMLYFAFTLQALAIQHSTFYHPTAIQSLTKERRLTSLAHVNEGMKRAKLLSPCRAVGFLSLFRVFCPCSCPCFWNYEWSIERSAICSFESRRSTFCPVKSKSI